MFLNFVHIVTDDLRADRYISRLSCELDAQGQYMLTQKFSMCSAQLKSSLHGIILQEEQYAGVKVSFHR